VGLLSNLWHKYLWGKAKPWADFQYDAQTSKLVIKNYNEAFVQKLRNDLGTVAEGKPDEKVVQLYGDRETLEHEEPKLEVLHMGVDENGHVKMKLDWNKAFIDHIAKHGFASESEEESVQAYLASLTIDVAEEQGLQARAPTLDGLREAFQEIEKTAAEELREAADQVKKRPRRRVQRSG